MKTRTRILLAVEVAVSVAIGFVLGCAICPKHRKEATPTPGLVMTEPETNDPHGICRDNHGNINDTDIKSRESFTEDKLDLDHFERELGPLYWRQEILKTHPYDAIHKCGELYAHFRKIPKAMDFKDALDLVHPDREQPQNGEKVRPCKKCGGVPDFFELTWEAAEKGER